MSDEEQNPVTLNDISLNHTPFAFMHDIMGDEEWNPTTLASKMGGLVPMGCNVMKIDHNKLSFYFGGAGNESDMTDEDMDAGIVTLANNGGEDIDNVILENMNQLMDHKEDGSDDDDDYDDDGDDDMNGGHGGGHGGGRGGGDDDDAKEDAKEDEDLPNDERMELFEELLNTPDDVLNGYFFNDVSPKNE